MVETYLDGLNEQQLEAVTYTSGPLLVEAGPGSGKTRVLTSRVAHLVATGTPPEAILAIAFTNKAANEMRSRLLRLLPHRSKEIWCSTFHSACSKILRSDMPLLGRPARFEILDAAACTRLLREVVKDLGYDQHLYTPAAMRSAISAAKNNNRTPEAAAAAAAEVSAGGDPKGDRAQTVARIYAQYQIRLIRSGCVDFDDLLMLTLQLLTEHPDALRRWQDRFSHVLIDEYQDTNLVQNSIALALTDTSRALTAVGDSDQGIYSFRGADTRNILELSRHFPDLRVVRLERNYRSSAKIVDACTAMIAHNTKRNPKALWTAREPGAALTHIEATDETNEAEIVAASVTERRATAAASWDDMAVLYRVNAQSRPLELALSQQDVPFTVLGGVSFYERREVKDALAYLRIIDNPDDDESLLRALRSPSRAIGPKTISQIDAHARSRCLSTFEALHEHRNIKLWFKAADGIREFLATYAAAAAHTVPAEALREVVERSGMRALLQAEDTPESLDRLANLTELIGAASQHLTIADFLHEADEVAAAAVRSEDKEPTVKLVTLHSSKGLEFSDVYIVGCEEGLMPLRFSEEIRADVEEERRLAYVGMTRAKNRLTLSSVKTRSLYNETTSRTPSRFLSEVPSALIETTRPNLNDATSIPAPQHQPASPRRSSRQHPADSRTHWTPRP